MLPYLVWIGLILSATILVYQDFKNRLLTTWLIVLFTVCNSCLHLTTSSVYKLIQNFSFCVCYFLLCYFILHLYFYIKTKKFQKIIDSKIGLGDVLIFFSIGSCIEPNHLIFFFTCAFIISALAFFLFFQTKTSVPLVGFLLPCYLVYSLIMQSSVAN